MGLSYSKGVFTYAWELPRGTKFPNKTTSWLYYLIMYDLHTRNWLKVSRHNIYVKHQND